MTGSVPRKMAKGLQRVSAPCSQACWNCTYVTRLNMLALTTML